MIKRSCTGLSCVLYVTPLKESNFCSALVQGMKHGLIKHSAKRVASVLNVNCDYVKV